MTQTMHTADEALYTDLLEAALKKNPELFRTSSCDSFYDRREDCKRFSVAWKKWYAAGEAGDCPEPCEECPHLHTPDNKPKCHFFWGTPEERAAEAAEEARWEKQLELASTPEYTEWLGRKSEFI